MDEGASGEEVDRRAAGDLPETTGHRLMENFSFQDSNLAGFTAGILVGILTLLILFLWWRRQDKRDSLLIVGPSDAGKTLLFCQLVYGKSIETYTSLKENSGIYSPPSSSISMKVWDLPGSDKLRRATLDEHKAQAKAVLFVIDSSTMKQHIRDSAEFLFMLLSEPTIFKNRLPMLVVCNKQDAGLGTKGAGVIERELAKEIGLLRETRSRPLASNETVSGSSEAMYLGQPDKEFEFADLTSKVVFCEASANKDCNDEISGIPKIRDWISSVA